MRKPRSSVVKLQFWRIAIFNYLKEKVKSTEEIVKECSQKWEESRRKWHLETKKRTNFKEKPG